MHRRLFLVKENYFVLTVNSLKNPHVRVNIFDGRRDFQVAHISFHSDKHLAESLCHVITMLWFNFRDLGYYLASLACYADVIAHHGIRRACEKHIPNWMISMYYSWKIIGML